MLSSLLIARLYLVALERQHTPEDHRTPHSLYIDEFPTFLSDVLISAVSEARKYGLFLTLSHQFLDQIPYQVRSSIFGNVGTWMVFRIGMSDSEVMEKEFYPQFKQEHFQKLANYRIIYKHLRDGHSTIPGSIATLPPLPLQGDEADRDTVIRVSKERYTRPRAQVEAAINKRLKTW